MDLESSVKVLEQTVNSVSPAVVMVVSYDKSGAEIARGSGFFISREGKVIANASVVKDAYSAEVISEQTLYPDVAILSRADHLDMALLQVEADAVRFLNLDFAQKIKPGEKVLIIGKAPERKRTLSEGSISSVLEIDGGNGSILEVQIAPSLLPMTQAKDGPLLNVEGNFIGLTSARISELQNKDEIPLMPDSFKMTALSASAMKPLLAGPGDAVYLKRARSRVWTAWLGRQVKTFAISGFIILYSIGFPKLLALAFMVIVAISLIQWLFIKIKRRSTR